MKINIHIPTPLRPFVGNQDIVETHQEGTVGEVLSGLVNQYPELEKNLYDKNKVLRKFVNVYVDDEDIRYIDGENTPVKIGQSISIIPSIAGGAN